MLNFPFIWRLELRLYFKKKAPDFCPEPRVLGRRLQGMGDAAPGGTKKSAVGVAAILAQTVFDGEGTIDRKGLILCDDGHVAA